jgi:hypothetical protein
VNLLIGGRTSKSKILEFLLSKLNNIFTVDKFKELYPDVPVILYGEGYGNKIQKKGKHYIENDVDFILFDVLFYNKWINRKEVDKVAEKLEIKSVPIIGTGTIDEAIKLTEKGFNSTIGNCVAEGIVIRPFFEMTCNNRRVIAKVKHRDFKEE